MELEHLLRGPRDRPIRFIDHRFLRLARQSFVAPGPRPVVQPSTSRTLHQHCRHPPISMKSPPRSKSILYTSHTNLCAHHRTKLLQYATSPTGLDLSYTLSTPPQHSPIIFDLSPHTPLHPNLQPPSLSSITTPHTIHTTHHIPPSLPHLPYTNNTSHIRHLTLNISLYRGMAHSSGHSAKGIGA